MSKVDELLEKLNLNEAKKVDWSDLPNVSYADALKMINTRGYYAATKVFKDLDFGSGGFEKWFEMQGGKITLSDVKKMSANDCASLLSNVFYGRRDLTSALKEPVLKAVITKAVGKVEVMIFQDGYQDVNKYTGPWKNLAKFLAAEENAKAR